MFLILSLSKDEVRNAAAALHPPPSAAMLRPRISGGLPNGGMNVASGTA